jgi:hypothetical protein
MAGSQMDPRVGGTISLLLRMFTAYTRARTAEERSQLERVILELFASLGTTDDQSLVDVRNTFEGLRTQKEIPLPDRTLEREAREFTAAQISAFERPPAGVTLSGPAREMLKIPLSEAVRISHEFNRDEAAYSIARIYESLRRNPTSEIEGHGGRRTSIAVIRAYAQNFCNIPPFCSGKSN